MVADLDAEGAGQRGDPPADGPEAENTDAAPRQTGNRRHPLHRVAMPPSRPDEAVALDDAARAGQHRADSEFGDAGGVGVAAIAQEDAAASGTRLVDALDARAIAGDQPQTGQRVDQAGIGRERPHGDEHGCILRAGRQGFRRRMRHRAEQPVALPHQRRHPRGQARHHQDRWLHHIGSTARMPHCTIGTPWTQQPSGGGQPSAPSRTSGRECHETTGFFPAAPIACRPKAGYASRRQHSAHDRTTMFSEGYRWIISQTSRSSPASR